MDDLRATVVAVWASSAKGTRKWPVAAGALIADRGLDGDAHAGPWHRQVSLLADEEVERMRAVGLDLPAGAFGENLVTRGVHLEDMPVDRCFQIGTTAVLEVTQHGKECHARCAIHRQAGDCIMPRVGVFARVLAGGLVRPGDRISPVAEDRAVDRGAR